MNRISKIIFGMANKSGSKRVISLKPAKVSIPSENAKLNKINQPKQQKMVNNLNKDEIPQQWESMDFDKLCSLSSEVLQQISIQIKKTKMNAPDQLFTTQAKIVNPLSQLTPYYSNIYKIFCNLESVQQQKITKYEKSAYLAKMIDEDPQQDETLKNVIEHFVNNNHNVPKLQGFAEPTFCKYLLSLKRDLLMQGLDINTHVKQQPKSVKILRALNYQYQFWVDIKHNRSKNGNQQDFIVLNKQIDNPNTSIFMVQEWPKINVTYITRKKKRKQIEMCFCIKTVLQIQVDGIKHIIKVQKKGPSDAPAQTQFRNGYAVIDYDDIYNGNPTIKPIFQF